MFLRIDDLVLSKKSQDYTKITKACSLKYYSLNRRLDARRPLSDRPLAASHYMYVFTLSCSLETLLERINLFPSIPLLKITICYCQR